MTTRRHTKTRPGTQTTARWRGIAFLLFVALLGGLPRVLADTPRAGEYDIKAAFLYNFVKYVDFPPQAFPPNSSTLTIGVAGKDPFGPSLDTIGGKSVKGRTLVIKRLGDSKDLSGINVLFVSVSEKDRLKPILDSARNLSILTIGEMSGFAKNGGIINFTTENNKVRFEVNPDSAEKARLKISSQLLKLAKVVKS